MKQGKMKQCNVLSPWNRCWIRVPPLMCLHWCLSFENDFSLLTQLFEKKKTVFLSFWR